MEITEIRCVSIEGTLDRAPDGYYEDRLASPLAVYQEFRKESVDASGGLFPVAEDGRLALEQAFLTVETSEGITGLCGPLDWTTAILVLDIAEVLLGRDPLATEKLWDVLYRQTVHSRKGKTVFAISALDCALWDIKGKYYDEPVYRLLGGPTRKELPTYASALWFSTESDAVREQSRRFADQGFEGQKWFFKHGPGSGAAGKRANQALASTIREAVGEDHDVMFDAWTAWDRPYTMDMIERLAPVEPAWLEEPVAPDALEALADVTAAAPFPIAGGEHEYTRWGFHQLLKEGALDVLQPDPLWTGGITETQKICSLASTHGVPVSVHGISVPACVHVVAAHPPSVCPRVEYLVRPNEALQHFFTEPMTPQDGAIQVPSQPGLGIELDQSAVENETEIGTV